MGIKYLFAGLFGSHVYREKHVFARLLGPKTFGTYFFARLSGPVYGAKLFICKTFGTRVWG